MTTVLFACASTSASPSPPATLPLAAPTSTNTPPPFSSTEPPAPLSPQEVMTLAVTQAARNVPSVDEQFARLALEDAAGRAGLDAADFDVVYTQAARWAGATLNCSAEDVDPGDSGIDGYRMILLNNDQVYDYRAAGDTLRFCGTDSLDSLDPDTLILVDPVAGDLVALGQRRLSGELGIPTRRVRLIALDRERWTDSSLGCPLEGQVYQPVITDGYRIVLSAGTVEYVFHTSFDRLILCEPNS